MTQSIRNKMILFIGAPTVAIYIAVMVWILIFSKWQAHRFHRQEMMDKAETAAARFDDYVSKAAKMSEVTAGFITQVPDLTEAQVFGLVEDLVNKNSRIHGAALAFEPGMFKAEDTLFCPYAYRSEDKVKTMNIGKDVYDWYGDKKWQWWHQPKEQGKGGWTKPYIDEGAGEVMMMTYATPFKKNGKFYGVATVDIDLESLHVDIGQKIVGDKEFYVLSADGRFMYSPDKEQLMKHDVFEFLEKEGRKDLEADAREMLAGKSGVVTLDDLFEKDRHMYAFAPIPSTGWTFVTYMPESEALNDWRQRMAYIVSAFVGALVLILAAIWRVSGRLTKPIEKLRATVLLVADGDLDARVDGDFSNDEIGELAKNFNRMTVDLKGHVLNLAHEEAGREKAEAESKANSEFLSHMSHELRTPLNGILGYAQILQRDAGLPEKQQGSVDSIISCGDHLLSLINDVLDLSKSKAGHLELDLAPCDLHKLTTEVGDIVRQRASEKQIEFGIELLPEVPRTIVSDAPKIRQILVNLLGNAVKFTAKGSVNLRVFQSPQGLLQFDVTDTGVGIAAEEIEQIFDPFKQVEAGKAAGGTGLGLAICERLAKILGGEIKVHSNEGEGSTFSVMIPVEKAPAEIAAQLDLENKNSRKVSRLAPGQKVTVLIADDRIENREILNHLLTNAGFETLMADDGDVAIELIKKGGVDIVLMDVYMPRLSGIEAVKIIRKDETFKDIKIVAVTASVSAEFRVKVKEVGFDDFMGKPFWVDELMRILQKHLTAEFECDDLENASNDEDKGLSETDLRGVSEQTVEKLGSALKIRNLTAIKELAKDLEANESHSALGKEISKLSAAFDFKALAILVDKLK